MLVNEKLPKTFSFSKNVVAVKDNYSAYTNILSSNMLNHIKAVKELNEDAKEFTDAVIDGVHRSAIIYGQSGMGKTYIITDTLKKRGMKEGADYAVLRSHASPMMLYIMLYLMRQKNKFVILDDCDGIISQESGINLLKAATDNTFRQVGWASSQHIRNPINEKIIPSSFNFNGSIIITTNVSLAVGRSKIAQHMDALRSRAASYQLNLKTKEEQFAQIFHMVVDNDYLSNDADTTLTEDEKAILLEFLYNNINIPRRLDLRLPQIIARELKNNKNNWERRVKRLLEAA